MQIRLVHRNGEEKIVHVGVAGYTLQIYWPLAGWYRVYCSSGRVAGAKSWHVHPDDLGRLVPPKKPKKPRKGILTQ